MPRVKGGMNTRRGKKKIFKLAKGNWGGRGNRYRAVRETVLKGLKYAYRDRRQRKREFRQMWEARINAAIRFHGLSYSRFIDGLNKANIGLNRKMLSEIAIRDENAFGQIATLAKKALTIS